MCLNRNKWGLIWLKDLRKYSILMYWLNILFFFIKYVEFLFRSFVLFLVLGRIIYEREVFLKWID